MKIMKKLKYILTLTFAACLIYSCKDKKEIATKNTKYCLNDTIKKKIEFFEPSLSLVSESIPLTGSVETNPDKVVNFVSLVSGIISKTNFSLGDKVTKGQVLAELRSTELSSLKAEFKNLDTQIKVAKQNLQSIKAMYDDGISSLKQLLEAESELNILVANRDKVDSNLKLFSASSEKGVFQIKAPTTGFVTEKNIATGTQIAADGESLFTISDLNEVWVMANIYATNVEKIQTGMDIKIKTLSYPDRVFEGKVATISQVFDSEAKVLKARIVINNFDLKLKPGMLVDIIALKQQKTKAVSIPTCSLVFDNDQNLVVVYKNDCEMEIRKVEILSSNNDITFLAAGLKQNEKIISKNQLLIYEQIKNFQN